MLMNCSVLNQSQLDNIVGTIVGGILLAVILFLAKEYLFTTPQVGGKWTLEMNISESSYKPYLGLTVTYHIVLVQIGNQIKGTGEKIEEKNLNTGHTLVYSGANRKFIVVEGIVNKKYFSRSSVTLHCIEEGQLRLSSTVHTLNYYRNAKQLKGTFFATAADSRGDSAFTKS